MQDIRASAPIPQWLSVGISSKNVDSAIDLRKALNRSDSSGKPAQASDSYSNSLQ